MAKYAAFALAALLPAMSFAQQTIVLRDGSRYNGAMVRADENSITFRDDRGQRRNFDASQIRSIEFKGDRGNGNDDRAFGSRDNRDRSGNNGSSSSASNYNNGSNNNDRRSYMTLDSGTEISVRTNEAVNAQDSNSNRMYSAQIDRDVTDRNGRVVIPRGSDAQLTIRNMGDRQIALDLQSITANGRRYDVDSGEVTQQSQGRDGVGANKRTGEYVGGGAVLGTLLGAIAGGGKGAAIGALAGSAAGAGTQVLTRGSQVRVPAETVLSFRLDSPLRLR